MARQNAAKKKNQHLSNIGAAYRVDFVKADLRRKKIDVDRQASRYAESLIELQRAGWIVCFQTIILPETARPSLGRRWHWWGLAGSPDGAVGAQILLDIQRSALPRKDVSNRLGGFWVFQAHTETDQLHQHGCIAFRSQHELDAYVQRLRAAYASLTYKLRNLRVCGGFGVGFEVEGNAINLQALSGENDIRKSVIYAVRELDSEVNLMPASRRHASFGALAVRRANLADKAHCTKLEAESGGAQIKHNSEAYDQYLQAPCASLIHDIRNLRTTGARGVNVDVEHEVIDPHVLPCKDSSAKTVKYSTRELDRAVRLISATRRYVVIEPLATVSSNQVPCRWLIDGQVEDARIKHFPHSQSQEKALCIRHFFSAKTTFLPGPVLFSTALAAPPYFWPQIRAPPTYFNPLQGCPIYFLSSYSIHLILNGADNHVP
ncbi:MAG: hypothetical protein CML17_07265 [Pusillimonas sp.]|nr:hypothetical protein [Pusillimonas sp.]